MIEVSHLSKKYGTHPAIEDLSFTVGDGQIFGLLGPNGAGKSTIMKVLYGMEKAAADVENMSEKAESIVKSIGDNEFLIELINKLISREK